MKATYLFVLLVTLLLVGCAAQDTEKEADAAEGDGSSEGVSGRTAKPVAAREADVKILGQEFDPAEVTVKVGGTVTWTNDAGRVQMMAGPKKLFQAKLADGESFSYKFQEAGEYKITNTVPIPFAGTVIVE